MNSTKMISAKTLKSALAVIKPCLSRDAAKAALTKVAIITNSDGTWFGATDGHRMCLIKVSSYNAHNATTAVSFKLLADQKEGIDLTFTEGARVDHVCKINGIEIPPSQQYGQYPNIFQLMPKNTRGSRLCVTEVKAKELLDGLKTLGRQVKTFDITNEFTQGCNWIEDPQPIHARFYWRYLKDLATACKRIGQTQWNLNASGVCVVSANDFYYLLMPIRIK